MVSLGVTFSQAELAMNANPLSLLSLVLERVNNGVKLASAENERIASFVFAVDGKPI